MGAAIQIRMNGSTRIAGFAMNTCVAGESFSDKTKLRKCEVKQG